MKANPFMKYIKGETAIHFAVAEYLQYQYPHVMFHHSPNESKRTPFERFLVSKMGVSAGFPDFVIYGGQKDIYLELKYKDNTPTDSQLKWLKHFYMDDKNFPCVAWSFESAKNLINSIFKKGDSGIIYSIINSSYYIDSADSLPSKIKKLINL